MEYEDFLKEKDIVDRCSSIPSSDALNCGVLPAMSSLIRSPASDQPYILPSVWGVME